MKDLKISLKLFISFGIIIVLTIAVGVTSIFFLRDSSGDTAQLNTRADGAIISARLNRNIQSQRSNYRDAFLGRMLGLDADIAEDIEEMNALDTEFTTELASLDAMLSTEEGLRLLETIQNAYPAYSAERDKLFVAIQDSSVRDEDVQKIINESITPNLTPLTESIAALTDYIEKVTDDMATDAAKTSTIVTWVVIGIVVFSAVFAIFLSMYISRMISTPVIMMMGLLKQVGDTGNLYFPDEVKERTRAETKYKDELSQSLAAFVKMMDQMIYYGEALEKVADQDLSIEVRTLGGNDTMGNALTKMLDNLNRIFGEISSAAEQVGGGSAQIASAAQSLASGTTEQAATVEELSSSMQEFSSAAGNAAQSARKAAVLSDGVRGKAEAGSEQMKLMMEAVHDISKASQRIGEVVKVIDDIAFQTNILALNAAVEAARAGQHGKGFAVVADEVRNLASKSAAAAKDTNDLIASSISKAAEGVQIAESTNQALLEIVSEIVESSAMSTEIADSAATQATQVTQVSTGLEQVSQVVQQNSATAEESAAASEELSGQSSIMRDMVAAFRLRGDSAPNRTYPAYSGSKHLPATAQGGAEKGIALQISTDKY
jgi:methyl-accepting chemotaxis protein